jgi:hypothetical protein
MPSFSISSPLTDAQFNKSGDVISARIVGMPRNDEIVLTLCRMGKPFLVHTQLNTISGRP